MTLEAEECFVDFLRMVTECDDMNGPAVGWLLDQSDSRHFIQWINNNIDASNVLTTDELREYENLKSEGTVLCGASLDAALEAVRAEEDLETDGLKKDISETRKYCTLIDEKVSLLLNRLSEMTVQKNRLKERIQASQLSLGNAREQCLLAAANADKARQQLVSNLSNLCHSFQQQECEAQLICETPLEKWITLCMSFQQDITEVIKAMDAASQEESKTFSKAFFELGAWKQESYLQNIKENEILIDVATLTQHSMEYILNLSEEKAEDEKIKDLKNFIEDFENNSLDISSLQLRRELQDWGPKVNALEADIRRFLSTELYPQVEQAAETVSVGVRLPAARSKLRWVQHQLSVVQALQQSSQLQVAGIDLLWMVLAQEVSRLDNTEGFLQECLNFLDEERSQSQSAMRMLAGRQNKQCDIMSHPLVKMLQQLLLPEAACLKNEPLSAFHDAFTKLKTDIGLEEQHLYRAYFETKKMGIQRDEKYLSDWRALVFSGPTKEFELDNFELKFQFYDVEKITQQVVYTLKKVNEDQKKKKQCLYHQPLLKTQRLLWSYFLTDPNALRQSLLEVKGLVNLKTSHLGFS